MCLLIIFLLGKMSVLHHWLTFMTCPWACQKQQIFERHAIGNVENFADLSSASGSLYSNGVMTLYWYIHWFWITYQCYACLCDETATVHSVTEGSSLINETHRTPKFIGGVSIPSNISPASVFVNATAFLKPRKSMNHTHNVNGTTVLPPAKETTVIDLNTADLRLNSTDSMISRTDNFTLSDDEKYVNNSLKHTTDRVDNLSAAGITGITLGCVSVVGLISAVSYILYRNRGFNRPQVLNDHCSNLDSSGYIDDTSVRDNSEEMYSLDNDSFLNSLEAMTIQNYWTDTVKHTKL